MLLQFYPPIPHYPPLQALPPSATCLQALPICPCHSPQPLGRDPTWPGWCLPGFQGLDTFPLGCTGWFLDVGSPPRHGGWDGVWVRHDTPSTHAPFYPCPTPPHTFTCYPSLPAPTQVEVLGSHTALPTPPPPHHLPPLPFCPLVTFLCSPSLFYCPCEVTCYKPCHSYYPFSILTYYHTHTTLPPLLTYHVPEKAPHAPIHLGWDACLPSRTLDPTPYPPSAVPWVGWCVPGTATCLPPPQDPLPCPHPTHTTHTPAPTPIPCLPHHACPLPSVG